MEFSESNEKTSCKKNSSLAYQTKDLFKNFKILALWVCIMENILGVFADISFNLKNVFQASVILCPLFYYRLIDIKYVPHLSP